jgi:hypothetical protein
MSDADQMHCFREVRSIVYAIRGNHQERRPSATRVIEVMRLINRGHAARRQDVCAALKALYDSEDGIKGQENIDIDQDSRNEVAGTYQERTGTSGNYSGTEGNFQEPASDEKPIGNKGPSPSDGTGGNFMVLTGNGTELSGTSRADQNRNPETVNSTDTSYPTPRNARTHEDLPKRQPRLAKPLPEIPPEFADDIDRLIASDAGTRRDGKIADSVVKGNLKTLRIAFERKGVHALRAGIDVALGKGKGLRYAAGCVRNASEDAPPTIFPLRAINGGRADTPRHYGNPDIDAIPEPLDPATTDFRKVFAGMKKAVT